MTDGERPPGAEQAPPEVQPAPVQERIVYVERRGNGLAVAALVCGIAGAVMGLGPAILYIIPMALGAVAFVLGIFARRRAKQEPEVGRKGMATWGIALGLVAIAFGIVGAVTIDNVGEDLDKSLEELERDTR